MSDFILIGTLLGLVIGLIHAVYLSRLVTSGAKSATPGTRVSALGFALWTCGLWMLMGAYVLGFWLIAIVFYIVFKVYR